MASAYLLLALIWGTAASLGDVESAQDSTRLARNSPPAVVSFLERLKSLRTPRSQGGPENNMAAALQTPGSPLYIQPEEATDVFMSHRRPVPHRRERRHISPSIAMRGCHLGTCQTQNLANMLYRLGYNTGKEGSNKNTRDPQGYGRRRRSLPHHLSTRRTTWVQRLLDT